MKEARRAQAEREKTGFNGSADTRPRATVSWSRGGFASSGLGSVWTYAYGNMGGQDLTLQHFLVPGNKSPHDAAPSVSMW